jgi:hypothetical protein
MAFDDRDYYREELARKRGVRPPLPFGQPIATTTKQSASATVSAATPLLDAMIGEKRPPKRWPWLGTFALLASIIVAEAVWLLHS